MAGVVGAGSLVLALLRPGRAPDPTVSAGLLVLGIFGFAIDVQAGVPRTWTVIGTSPLAGRLVPALTTGMSCPGGPSSLVVGGVALFMVAGMPAMVRARFSTPTIGRESMIGEMGAATADVDPEGTVTVRGALWRARTNRATPIAAGERRAGGGDRRPAARGRARGGRRQGRPPLAPCTPWTDPPLVQAGWDGCRVRARSEPGGGGSLAVSSQRAEDLWQDRAACQGPQAAVFFPPPQFERKDEKEDREQRAKAICATCPSAPCLDYAISIREPHGIWGGLNELERKALLADPGGLTAARDG